MRANQLQGVNNNSLYARTFRVSLLAALIFGSFAYPHYAGAQEKGMNNPSTVSQASLPRVLILTTGGTIAGAATGRNEGAYTSGVITPQQLVDSVKGIGDLARISTEQVSNIGSQDMNDVIWFKLAKRIKQAFDHKEADAVVITHGTDTMEETAFFLNQVLASDKPVVLVGSMRPSTALGADGPANIYQAVKVATDKQSAGRGVLVAMNDTIESARDVTKTDTTSLQTMQSPHIGTVGYVDMGHVRFIQRPVELSKPLSLPQDGNLPRVEIIYGHSNMDTNQIEHAIADKAKGIVLAGLGDGNASKEALVALEKAAAKGIVVVRSTRVAHGYVNRDVEIDDQKSGFVASMDLSPQKSRILVQLLVANSITDPAQVQQAFSSIK
ncbi:L-asparaginase [Pseudomonas cedrina]|uniref:Glutaminase-asparaginase n=2 Tax=Pseudomonas cedrina TaxID=651740 RepID=A0A1V2K2A8_PSECE|nr:asparaginase [Pseudomonas cedrina]ONH51584.1 L-asparaginase 2 [Pseudomonas cedrina subsp. cedrina]SDT11722.1 L-asparaginase [Pseudomonas cedrina]